MCPHRSGPELERSGEPLTARGHLTACGQAAFGFGLPARTANNVPFAWWNLEQESNRENKIDRIDVAGSGSCLRAAFRRNPNRRAATGPCRPGAAAKPRSWVYVDRGLLVSGGRPL